MSNYRHIEVSESNDVTVVKFMDRKILDEASIQELGQELFSIVEQDDKPKVVLNFANVEFLSSAVLGKLIAMDKKAKQNECRMILTNVRPEIYQVFEITKLSTLFEIKDDEADALAVF